MQKAAESYQPQLALYRRALDLSEDDTERQYAAYAGRERVYAQRGEHNKQAVDLESLRRLSGNEPAKLADLRNREALRLLRLGEFAL